MNAKYHTDQNVIGVHNENHGLTMFPSPLHTKQTTKLHTRATNSGRLQTVVLVVVDVTAAARRPPLSTIFDGGGTLLSSVRGRVDAVSSLVFICHCLVAVRLPIPMMMTTVTTTRRRTTTTRRRTTTTRRTMTTMTMNDNNDTNNNNERSCRKSIPP